MPVGTNGGRRGPGSQAGATAGGPCPRWPGPPVRSRICSRPGRVRTPGQARAGTGAVRSRDWLDGPVAAPREERQNPATGWSGAAGAGPGAVLMSRDQVPRIGSALVRPARRDRAGGRGDRGRGGPGGGDGTGRGRRPVGARRREIPAGLDDVLEAWVGLARRLSGHRRAWPELCVRARRRGCGLSGPACGQLGTRPAAIGAASAMAGAGAGGSRRGYLAGWALPG